MIGWIKLLAAGVAAYVGVKLAKKAVESHDINQLPSSCPSALRDCPPNAMSPDPSGGDPKSGMASALGYQWCHVVRRGDSAGLLAEKIVGDRSRYMELVTSNPQKGTAPIVLPDGRTEMNWRDKLCPQERLLLPKSWNPWIDQTGKPRGHKTPFPPFDTLPSYPVTSDGKGLLPTVGKGWAP